MRGGMNPDFFVSQVSLQLIQEWFIDHGAIFGEESPACIVDILGEYVSQGQLRDPALLGACGNDLVTRFVEVSQCEVCERGVVCLVAALHEVLLNRRCRFALQHDHVTTVGDSDDLCFERNLFRAQAFWESRTVDVLGVRRDQFRNLIRAGDIGQHSGTLDRISLIGQFFVVHAFAERATGGRRWGAVSDFVEERGGAQHCETLSAQASPFSECG